MKWPVIKLMLLCFIIPLLITSMQAPNWHPLADEI